MIILRETFLDALKRRLMGKYVLIVRTENSVYTFFRNGKDVCVNCSSWKSWGNSEEKVTKIFTKVEIGKKMKFSFIPEGMRDEDCDGVILVETTKVVNYYYA